MFENRRLLISTKHQKEKVIAPLLEKALRVQCFVPENFDTDLLGTFTGEIERTNDPLTTARSKCLQAMKQFDCDLAIASEGSFGPHPSMFFVNADDEILLLIDSKNELEIYSRELSTETNFNGTEIKSLEELLKFAEEVKFPSHGIILRNEKESNISIIKNITDFQTLISSYESISAKFGVVYAETDMRAMNNPTRMKVIENATFKLIEKIKSECPNCSAPGFSITNTKKGLPCSLCGMPTQSIIADVYECKKCFVNKEVKFPLNKTEEDPMLCNFCNP